MIPVNVYVKAIKSYAKACQNNRLFYQQPNVHLSYIGRKYVYLVNVRGPIARYLIKERKMHPDDVAGEYQN